MKPTRTAFTSLFVLAALPAHAHPGHGLLGFSHWHATDVLGYVALAVAAAAAAWWLRRK